jgi:hypothetical protein
MLKAKHLGLLGLLIVASVLALIFFIFFPSLPDPKCAALLARPESDVDISIPANCIQTTDVPSDDMVKYLENERNTRGLVFKKWITCKTSNQTATPGFAFERDPRWLPSYVPLSIRSGARSSSSPTHSPFPKDLLSWPKYA